MSDDLIARLRAMSRYEHDDSSIGDEAADRIEALEAECERLRQDAERYRWLLAESAKHHDLYSNEPRWMVSVKCMGVGQNYFGDKIDAAIDAAIKGERK
jgi:hypothetical protein